MEVNVAEIIDAIEEEIDDERLQVIVESIKEKGLLHPVAVHRSNGSYNLVAGKKRLLAFKQLGIEKIKVEVLGDNFTPEDAHEFRLHENIKRANLPWWEEVKLVKELHELRQRQKGIPDVKAGPVKTGWSLRDTAAELQRALGQVSQDITVAREVERDPTLRNVADKKTALRLIKQKVKRMEQEEMQGLDIVEVDPNQVFCGLSADVLKSFPDSFIDAVITDPPWIEYRDRKLTKDEETWPVFKELYRVMKWDSFLFMFVGTDDFFSYKEYLPSLGFSVQGHPNIWYKTAGLLSYGVRPWESQRNLELLVVAVKGNPTLVKSTQQSCIYEYPVIPPALLRHPNEKPVDLIKYIIESCTYDGAFILDPFGGSGVTAVASKVLKRRYLVIERDKTFYDNIVSRLEKMDKGEN